MRILIYRLILSCLLFTVSVPTIKAQKAIKLRSALSVSGSSKSFTSKNKQYHIKQSIGQSGISGTISNKNKTLIQGFIQPNIPKAKASTVNELEVLIETIPFSDSYKIILKDGETTDLNVSLYNIVGQKIYSQKINQSDEFEINLGSHSIGCYILCIQANQKQFTTKLLKK